MLHRGRWFWNSELARSGDLLILCPLSKVPLGVLCRTRVPSIIILLEIQCTKQQKPWKFFLNTILKLKLKLTSADGLQMRLILSVYLGFHYTCWYIICFDTSTGFHPVSALHASWAQQYRQDTTSVVARIHSSHPEHLFANPLFNVRGSFGAINKTCCFLGSIINDSDWLT